MEKYLIGIAGHTHWTTTIVFGKQAFLSTIPLDMARNLYQIDIMTGGRYVFESSWSFCLISM